MTRSNERLRTPVLRGISSAQKAALGAIALVWIIFQPFDATAQGGGVTPTQYDSQHCPPIACGSGGVGSGNVLPEGCSCLAEQESSIKCHNVKFEDGHTQQWCRENVKGPANLPAPPGCNPDEVKQQISTLSGTLKFLTAGPQCAISPQQCDAIPNRRVELLSDGSMVCQPVVCKKDTNITIGGKDLPFVGHVGGINFSSMCLSLPVKPVRSVDPNDKEGPSGATNAQFVRGDSPLSYTIHFENLATATAPAQTVVVTDQLDPQKVDLDSFRLGPIAFGADSTLAPAPGVRGWTGSVDLRPAQNLIVAINAGIDRSTGLVAWRLTSLDPATLQLTNDPAAGFLPPNANPPQGEGSVTFTVMPEGGLATGTMIQNQALVVFDTNAPIPTLTWLNTIDRDPPVTHVMPLPVTQTSATFPVQWTGSDAGSGIGAFTILVSDNGGPFAIWLDSVPDSSAMYPGEVGHSYAFLSLGTDLVGNVEPLKTMAEAATQIVSAPACASDVNAQLQVTRSGFGYNFSTQRFEQMVTLKNISAVTIVSPISLVLDSLSSNATLYNATGTTACATPAGSPFINWLNSLAPGASASIVLQFTNPTKGGITYATRALDGTAGR
jgi:uncharacterized repeat protein (TIGR01451 family)